MFHILTEMPMKGARSLFPGFDLVVGDGGRGAYDVWINNYISHGSLPCYNPGSALEAWAHLIQFVFWNSFQRFLTPWTAQSKPVIPLEPNPNILWFCGHFWNAKDQKSLGKMTGCQNSIDKLRMHWEVGRSGNIPPSRNSGLNPPQE